MNNLNKKINNLFEIIGKLRNKKSFNNTINYNFYIDDRFGKQYQTGIRKADKESKKLYDGVYIVSTYQYSSYKNDLENILKNSCYIITNKNNSKYIKKADLITDLEYKNKYIEDQIIDILLNKKGTKKDFKELDQDVLFIFYNLEPSFFTYSNIERIYLEQQLKNF